jgi:hypothetical protein
MTAKQQTTSQRRFNGDNLVQRINLYALTREGLWCDLSLAASTGRRWCCHGSAERLPLPLAELIAIPHQRQRRLRGIMPPEQPGQIASCQTELLQMLRVAKKNGILRMWTAMASAIRHKEWPPLLHALARQIFCR